MGLPSPELDKGDKLRYSVKDSFRFWDVFPLRGTLSTETILKMHFVVLSLLLLAIALSYETSYGALHVVEAPHPLPHVSTAMERPDFWIRKVPNPNQILLDHEEIQRMNEENLRNPALLLCRVQDMKEAFSREEIEAFFEEDWNAFGNQRDIRYGKDGSLLNDHFWNELKKNLNRSGLPSRSLTAFAFVVKRTDLRVFPTDEPGLKSPWNLDFDRFQHASLYPGSLVGIYHFSPERRWAYIQSSFIRGWVHAESLAIAREKREITDYLDLIERDRLVITGNSVPVYGDPEQGEFLFSVPMGSTFPFVRTPSRSPASKAGHTILLPTREKNGHLSFREAYIPGNEDVHRGFLPYTQGNLCRQAFKMLNEPYSWGERSGGRDCSRFILDLFACFGIVMPRNSKLQAEVGILLGPVSGKTFKEKQRLLEDAIPFATTLRLPGHIMLYLGEHRGRHFAIHSIWGVEARTRGMAVLSRIGKTVVSDLSLGKGGTAGSLFRRITDIRIIARPTLLWKKTP